MKILISTNDKPENYRLALEACGAEVVGGYLPEPDGDCDGLLLCGGVDIDPSRYGEENKGSADIDEKRDEIEWELLKLYRKKPIFGICRGLQYINIFFGGNLDQDIGTKAIHRTEDGDLLHSVTSEKGSVMNRLYGDSFTVNSKHHQAISEIAPGFRVTLRSQHDGIIEAIEHETCPIIAVQWHPERLSLGWKRDDAADGIGIFAEFLKMCEK